MDKDSKVAVEGMKEGLKEVVIREGDALTLREPLKVELSGNIKAPADFYDNRKSYLQENHCHVVFSRKDGSIVLTTDESNYYGTRITGRLLNNPDLTGFAINSGKTYTIKELQDKIKMSRLHFVDKDQCMKILADLSKSKIKIDTTLEHESSNSGSSRNNIEVQVKSEFNLKFQLKMPVFVGFDEHKFEVEICLNVRDKAVEFYLESVELKELMDDQTNKLIEAQIKRFGKIICIEQ